MCAASKLMQIPYRNQTPTPQTACTSGGLRIAIAGSLYLPAWCSTAFGKPYIKKPRGFLQALAQVAWSTAAGSGAKFARVGFLAYLLCLLVQISLRGRKRISKQPHICTCVSVTPSWATLGSGAQQSSSASLNQRQGPFHARRGSADMAGVRIHGSARQRGQRMVLPLPGRPETLCQSSFLHV